MFDAPVCARIIKMFMILEQTISLRVRYPEVDGMGYLHHSRFLQYFEQGRIELLRLQGHSYAELEKQGLFFVVVKAQISFKAPAKFDDQLELKTQIVKQTFVRLDHTYTLKREQTVVATGETTIACVDRSGQLIQIPQWLGGMKSA